MLPALHERSEVREIDGFDLLSERGECPPSPDFYNLSRAPLDIRHGVPEFSAHQLARSLPLGEPRLYPVALPSVAIVNLLRRYRTRLREKARQNLPPRDGSIDRSVAQHIRDESCRVLLDQLCRSTHTRQRFRTERGDVARIRLCQNEAPLLCFPLRRAGSRSRGDLPAVRRTDRRARLLPPWQSVPALLRRSDHRLCPTGAPARRSFERAAPLPYRVALPVSARLLPA